MKPLKSTKEKVMQEFMYFIKTNGDHMDHLSPEETQTHLQKVGQYIGKLMADGKLKSAQPLEMGGAVISNKSGSLVDGPFNETKEVLVGYFHILAKDLNEAVEIAKANPILDDVQATFEIRPIKVIEGIN